MSRYSEYQKRCKERETLELQLKRGTREIDRSVKSMDGWSDRIMHAILAPLKNNLEKYPIGHGTPMFGNGKSNI